MEARYATRLQADLRDRVIRTALGGVSVWQAAARYRIGISTTVLWVRCARSGKVSARWQGQQLKGFNLDEHATVLLSLIEVSSHISLHETEARLKQECGVCAVIGTLGCFFQTVL